jgi:APA family basic amino acid/polyamine antiporter
LRKELNLFDAVAVVVGTTIGSGIFLVPSMIAAHLHSFAAVLLVWLVGGFLTMCGALSLAELGSMYPRSGGICTYLYQAYGPAPAFLYAWALLFMIHSGSIAALGVAFGLYLGQIVHLDVAQQKIISVACILTLTTLSCLGIRGGKLMQNLVAIAKISGLVGIIVLLCVKGNRPIHLLGMAAAGDAGAFSLAGLGVALVAVLWVYEGWHVISFVAGEMKRPQCDLPRSLLYGSAIVMLTYALANVGYYHVLSPSQIRGSEAVAALAVGTLLGSIATSCISLLILISTLGSMNGLILTAPRVYYAMAHDGVFPRPFAQIDRRYRTPMVALLVQGLWAAVLAASGTYQRLFTDVIFTAWIFYGLAAAAVLVLRHKQPERERPFLVPGYPWLPLLFCAAATGLVLSTVFQQPTNALTGICLVVAGLPVYCHLTKSLPMQR